MSVFERLEARRAVRNYIPKEVEKEKIESLLYAATLAPNDRMREPWSFYVIQGKAKKEYESLAYEYLQERFPTKPKLVDSSMKAVTQTPVIIVVTSDTLPKASDSTDNEYAVCCAIHSMWLAAEEQGLGFVWRTRGVGLVHDERLHHFIGSPQDKKVVGTVFLGYPENSEGAEKKKKRTPYEEKTVWL
ncbi:nitroreductase family protein [Bacillus sp. FJAT-44742]|uniref:nitroreductase family protein n=1 Tax=Bacillus sp. FJAT-44742 TaxID=2014005 RepID=UPI000C234D5C|nr:nitroreductase [Bacillus sp. FJAT-44742]